MGTSLTPPLPTKVPCKCCATLSPLYGVVDFHKSCAPDKSRPPVLPLSGIPIYYYRCPECEFLFTTAFDHFTREDFAREIYNDEYVLVDPDLVEVRPRANAGFFEALFSDHRGLRILDYGCGTGYLGQLLRERGFTSVDGYDPFVPAHAARPPGRYQCIICCEVFEHSNRPLELLGDINSLLLDDGLVVFTTLLQPDNMPELGLSWWYVGPRNGHVSLFSNRSLLKIAGLFSLQVRSFNNRLTHVLFRRVPAFASHFISG